MENETVEILKMYMDEFKYRHENFWKRLTQFTVITFFTTTLPITFKIFDNLTLPNISLLFFPICGIFMTILVLFFCLSENGRLVATYKTIEKILEKEGGKKYLKVGFSLTNNEKMNEAAQKFPFFKWRIGTWVPIVLSILLLALAVLVIVLIATKRI